MAVNLQKRCLSSEKRMKIILAGLKIENKGEKATFAKLSKITKFDRRTCKLWWNRKCLLEKNGVLTDNKKGNSGRPLHSSFSTKKQIQNAINICENLQI